MTLVSCLIPVIISGFLLRTFTRQFANETSLAIHQGQNELLHRGELVLREMAENHIRQKALDVALQLDLYIQAHPEKTIKDLQKDPGFREIAVQPVGETGYTAIQESRTAINRFHKNPKIENLDLHILSGKLPGFWSIMEASIGGNHSSGYYFWREPDGTTRDKYMYIAPLKERAADQIPLGVAATTYIDEFTRPILAAKDIYRSTGSHLESTVSKLIWSSRNTGLVAMGIGILTVLVVVHLIGFYFSQAITSLKKAIRSVNNGDFTARLEPIMSGEVGELTEDFNAMLAQLASTTVSKELLKASEKELKEANGRLLREITERTQTAEALKQSEKQYRNLVDNALVGIFTSNLEGDILYVNEALFKMLEFESEDEMTSENVVTRYKNQKDRESFLEKLKKSSKVDGYEIEILTKKGDTKNVILAATLEQDIISGMILDITERKRAEDEVRSSEHRYRTTLDSMGTAIHVVDSNLRIVLFSTTFKEWNRKLGLDTEAMGKELFDVFPFLPDSVADEYRGVFDTGETLISEESTDIGGREIITETRKIPIHSEGGVNRVVTVVHEISKRKRAEETLREYERAVEGSGELIAVIDQHYKYRMVNGAFLRQRGLQRGRVIGHTVQELLGQETYENVVKPQLDKCFAGRIVSYEMQYAYPHSGERALEVKYFPLKDEHGQVLRVVSIIRDITERKKVEEEKEQMQAQLRQAQKMEAVGTLAGGIAHDFNNILQAVQGYAQLLLLERHQDDPDYQELEEIHRAAKRGGDLSRQLLTFSRRAETNLQSIDLNRELKNLLRMLERTIPKMIEIELHLTQDLRVVNADSGQVEQILMNLVVNAKDAMPDGGRLTIGTANVHLNEEHCRIHRGIEPGEYVELTISDTGHGMTKETLEHIFEPFYTTKGPGKGTGLGLAMVYGMVKTHRGHIRCTTEPGHGTSFKIYLPVVQTGDTKAEVHKESPVQGGAETILLVDDEESILSLGTKVLGKFGYEVFTAADGERALELYRKEQDKISMVILDLIMPGMGGQKCMKEILKLNPGAKIAVASGYSAEGPVKEVLNNGARGFVSKPYEVQQLLTTVREVLDET